MLHLHICSYTEDAVNSEIVSSKPKTPGVTPRVAPRVTPGVTPRVARKICLRQLSFLPFFSVYFSPSPILKDAKQIYSSYCHGRYMNNIDAPHLHSILLYLLLSFLLCFCHSYFPSCTPIFLPFSLSLSLFLFYIYSRFFFLSFGIFMFPSIFLSFVFYIISLCLLHVFSILYPSLFSYPCFRLPGRGSELRNTAQQLRSIVLYTPCYLTLDILLRYVNTGKVYESAN